MARAPQRRSCVDANRIDSLARTLAERPSRRRVLAALLGAVTAPLAGAAGRGLEAAPRCKKVDQACKTSEDCCPGPNRNGNVWCAADRRNSKTCQACPAETPTACNGGCVNTATDSDNCGDCGVVCPSGMACSGGICQCTDSTKSLCGGTCVNKSTDIFNCGSCGTQCFGGSSCVNGGCRCAHGQHFDATGTCTCQDTTCSGNGDCCNAYVCGNGGQCVPCSPAGTAVDNQAKCCSGVAVDGICADRCLSDAGCATGKGQVCSNGVCDCGHGAHMVAGGSCVCAGTGCGANGDCCDEYTCYPDDTCQACKPAGTTLTEQEFGSRDICCGRIECPTGEPNDLCVCMAACEDASDCVGDGQICQHYTDGSSYCNCPLGRGMDYAGNCICDRASCTRSDQCCDGYTCDTQNFVCVPPA